MNRELLDPFSLDFPEIITDRISQDYFNRCQFNYTGTLFATACFDGKCLIFNLETKQIQKVLFGHVRCITDICWTKKGDVLVTGGKDWNVILWDLLHNTRQVFHFASPIKCVQIHPTNCNIIIVCATDEQPVLINIQQPQKPTCQLENSNDFITITPTYRTYTLGKEQLDPKKKLENVYAACFNVEGDLIYLGSSTGVIYIWNVDTLTMTKSMKVTGGTCIKSIMIDIKGKDLLLNCNDRVIRIYTILNEGEHGIQLIPGYKFQDSVDRVQWLTCGFSANGEYIVGAAASKSKHKIYIWDKLMGNIIKILEGPMESILDLVWHPTRPLIISVSDTGDLYIWDIISTENWSAFAPDFRELEENIEYMEREDEFDIISEAVLRERAKRSEDEIVDITTCEEIAGVDTFTFPLIVDDQI